MAKRTVDGRYVVISHGSKVELYETDDSGLEIWLGTIPKGARPRDVRLREAVIRHETAVAS